MAANEIFSSFYTNIQDRLKNPFYGAFIISWLGWNWKFVALILFGYPTYYNVTSHIAKTHYLVLSIYPLLSAIIFIIVGPWLTLGIQIIKNKVIILSKAHKFFQQEKILEVKEKLLERQAGIKFIDDRVKIKYDNKKIAVIERENKAKLDEEFRVLEGEKEELEREKKLLQHPSKNIELANKKIEELKNEASVMEIQLQKQIEIEQELLAKNKELEQIRSGDNIPEHNSVSHSNKEKRSEKSLLVSASKNRVDEFKRALKLEGISINNLPALLNEPKSKISSILRGDQSIDETTLEQWNRELDNLINNNR